jgi:hypothetical protein
MTVFDVFLNDRKLCRAGVGDDGVLSAIVSWAKLTGEAAARARQYRQPLEETRLHVGGLRAATHRSWEERMLKHGDRISIVVSDGRTFDPPASTKPKMSARKLQRARQQNAPTLPATEFLNVDLDIVSDAKLQALVDAFGRRVCVLHVGRERRRYAAHLELAATPRNADRAIRAFAALVEGLPRSARTVWNNARRREFNIGLQAGRTPYSYELGLQPETLRVAAAIGTGVGVTVYAPPPRAEELPSRPSKQKM